MYFGVTPWRLRSASAAAKRVHPHPLLVKRDADRVDANPRQSVQRALIGLPLDNNGVAARQQRRVDEVERLQRAGDDQDIVGDAVDAGIALELCRQKFAKRTV